MLNKKQEIPTLNNLYSPVKLYNSKSWIVSTICKEDLKEYLTKKEIENINDSDMSYIADKMSDIMQENYWTALEYITEELKHQK